jgi:DNA-binding beta-propeller fold protein YncE
VDARADVYALGCLLFFTLTGALPFPRESDEAKLWAQLSDPPPKPSAHGAPEAFDAVVERALAKAPNDRYPSAGDLGRAALAAAAGRQPVRTERVVARGAAAPIEMETVTAHRPAGVSLSADIVDVEASRTRIQRARGPALLSVALFAAAGIGVVTALMFSRRENPSAAFAPTATPTATATQSPTPTPTPQLRATGSLKVGRRPNVARAAGGNVFVASNRRPRVSIIDARTRKMRSYAPNIGVGAADAAVGRGSVWLAVSRSHVVVRLDARTGRVRRRIPVAGYPTAIALSGDALWVALTNNGNVPDTLLKLDPRDGRTLASVQYRFGIASLTISPKALWVVSRFRSFTFRADPRTGEPVARVQIGHGPATDLAYGRGYIWVTVPEDDIVYKIRISTAEEIPIAVGHFPRQVELAGDTVYVTDYTSNDVYAIDARSSHLIGAPAVVPANPYSIAITSDAIWVTSPPEDRVTQLVTARSG